MHFSNKSAQLREFELFPSSNKFNRLVEPKTSSEKKKLVMSNKKLTTRNLLSHEKNVILHRFLMLHCCSCQQGHCNGKLCQFSSFAACYRNFCCAHVFLHDFLTFFQEKYLPRNFHNLLQGHFNCSLQFYFNWIQTLLLRQRQKSNSMLHLHQCHLLDVN